MEQRIRSKRKTFNAIFLIILLCSCSIGKSPIKYGEDHCAFCTMKIVQPQFGAELITGKGKVYKFDAVECLINKSLEDRFEGSTNYVIAFDKPEKLIIAEQSFYLRSVNIPSPMGMFISAFEKRSEAGKQLKLRGGDIYSWQELIDNFNSLPDLGTVSISLH